MEKELLARCHQGAFVPAAGLALALPPVVGARVALLLPGRLEGSQQPLELNGIKSGQGTQKPGLAENNVHLHASLPSKKAEPRLSRIHGLLI